MKLVSSLCDTCRSLNQLSSWGCVTSLISHDILCRDGQWSHSDMADDKVTPWQASVTYSVTWSAVSQNTYSAKLHISYYSFRACLNIIELKILR
jgi:hypothetical protein